MLSPGEIDREIKPLKDVVERLDTIPGGNMRVAQAIIAEVGTDMDRFPTAGHLASWAGLCPGNNESAGKHFSGHTRRETDGVGARSGEAAAAVSSANNTYLQAPFRRSRVGRARSEPWSGRPQHHRRVCRYFTGQAVDRLVHDQEQRRSRPGAFSATHPSRRRANGWSPSCSNSVIRCGSAHRDELTTRLTFYLSTQRGDIAIEEAMIVEKRRKFDADFKAGAVRMVRETGRDLGVNEGTLGNWCALDRRHRGRGDGELSESEQVELAMQRDLLKRAVAVWVREAMSQYGCHGTSTPRRRTASRTRLLAGHWACPRRGCTRGRHGDASPRHAR